ncbi:MAG: aminopeptidase P family N-terminal domain-containing protein, partial [Thermodesulfobacteriota bacterium]
MLLNQPRAVACMKDNGMDALIATHPNHVTYATNYGGHSPRIYLDRMVFSVLPLDLKAAILTPIGDASYLAENRASIWAPEIWTYGTSKITWPDDLQPDDDEGRLLEIIQDRDRNARSLPDLVALVLARKGLDRGVIGLDESGLNPDIYDKIRKACPKVRFLPAAEIWRGIELIKTDEELERMRQAARANEAAVGAVMTQIRPDVCEAELMQCYAVEAARRGAVMEFWNSAGGRRGGGFFPSGSYRLRKGDLYRY